MGGNVDAEVLRDPGAVVRIGTEELTELEHLNVVACAAECAGDAPCQAPAVGIVEEAIEVAGLREVVVVLGAVEAIDDRLPELPCPVGKGGAGLGGAGDRVRPVVRGRAIVGCVGTLSVADGVHDRAPRLVGRDLVVLTPRRCMCLSA